MGHVHWKNLCRPCPDSGSTDSLSTTIIQPTRGMKNNDNVITSRTPTTYSNLKTLTDVFLRNHLMRWASPHPHFMPREKAEQPRHTCCLGPLCATVASRKMHTVGGCAPSISRGVSHLVFTGIS